jgi:hypothetical protein
MSEIINLKRHRKRVAREEKDLKAEANRIRFGRTKAERDKQGKEKAATERHLDGHKRET